MNGETGALDVDVVIPATATTNEDEQKRRRAAPERALRTAVAGKLQRHGPSVIAFAIDDAGRLAQGTRRLLTALAAGQDPEDPQGRCRELRGEVQHLVFQGTAAMAQSAGGAVRTA